MTSKQRVAAAFASQEPDRVPINYESNPGIDGRLKAHFGLASDDDEGLKQALSVDFRGIQVPYTGPRLHEEIPDRDVNPMWGIRCRYIEHETGGYWDFCDFPLREADEETVAAWPMPSPDDYDYAGIKENCERYREYALHPVGFLGDIINGNGMLRGMEQVFVDLITEDPAGLLLTKRRMETQLEITRRTLEAAEGGLDFLWLGEDLGTQEAPIISMELFRKHIRPYYERFCDMAKAFDVTAMIHTCGSSSWAYEDFIEIGIKAVDTLQPEAKNMSPKYLKEHFGGRLAFHGCISTAGPVAYGSVQDVIDNVRDTLEIMMPGGGYCLAPTHQLQDNSPTENVIAMYEAAKKYGEYS